MKQLHLVLLLTQVCRFVESSPVHLGTLEFDNLDTDLDSLSYEVEEDNLSDYLKSLEDDSSSSDLSDNSVKNSGFKKGKSDSKKINQKHNGHDIKKLYKIAGIHNHGAYDDEDAYGQAEAAAAQAVGIKGKEDRKYRKGTKTRGFHRVHHKDEYKKDKLFYEDDETRGTINKIGAKGLGYSIAAGADFNKGNYHHDRHKGVYGRSGYQDKGGSNTEVNSKSTSQGFESYFKSK